MTNTKKITDEKIETIEQQEKGEMKMTEEIETIEEIEEGKRVFTLNREMEVEETTNLYSNPISSDYNATKLFLDNNFSIMEEYFEDENNNGIAFYECGYNGTAQQEFAQAWAEKGVRVF